MQLTLGFIESPSIFFFTEGRKSLDGSKGPPALSCSVHHSAHCSMCLLLHQQVHSQKSNARKSFSTPPSIASHHISMETIWCGLMGRLSCNSLRQKVDSTFLRTSEIAIFFFSTACLQKFGFCLCSFCRRILLILRSLKVVALYF